MYDPIGIFFAISLARIFPSVVSPYKLSSVECSSSHETSGDCLGLSISKSLRLVSGTSTEASSLACLVNGPENRRVKPDNLQCQSCTYLVQLPGAESTLQTT